MILPLKFYKYQPIGKGRVGYQGGKRRGGRQVRGAGPDMRRLPTTGPALVTDGADLSIDWTGMHAMKLQQRLKDMFFGNLLVVQQFPAGFNPFYKDLPLAGIEVVTDLQPKTDEMHTPEPSP